MINKLIRRLIGGFLGRLIGWFLGRFLRNIFFATIPALEFTSSDFPSVSDSNVRFQVDRLFTRRAFALLTGFADEIFVPQSGCEDGECSVRW